VDTSDAIAETLFGKTRRRVLGLLFGRPDESFYLRQIARLTSEGPGNVQRELKALTEAGLVTRDRQGKQVYFQADPDSPVFDDLRRLMEKTTGLADPIRAALASLQESGRIEFAFVFGSVATGEHTSGSDVDLMIAGDIRLSEIIPVLRPLQDALAREINPSIYSSEEFRERLSSGDHFITSVMKRPKLMIVGSKDELEELAG
jgi:DNA-binding transcriptional ArsR family regulator